jgi:BlaI family transcriptional regulator, penicillinase repressor
VRDRGLIMLMKKAQPSNLEMQVLAVLWERGPLPARQVLEALPDGKERAYTTVLSTMQVMEKKGLLRHETQGNRHIYAPAVKKGEVLGTFLRSLVSNVFGGSAANAMQHLLRTHPVSADEIGEMRALLDQYAPKKAREDKNL